ncbi:hypothetical protein C2G38_1762053 [Gigaspora rosea]|uniref:MI domain-containing protein n=1 Tax=Gigaspora rosea TaxID=44941 RepID=A0A397V1A4_9GLOM|nr:hypothetical protein C2G38_1762053 [Gigaspora rosea]
MSSYGSSEQSSVIGGTISVSRQAGDLYKFGSVARSKVPSSQFSLAPGGISRQAGDLSKFGSVARSKVPSSQFSLALGGISRQAGDLSKFGSVARSKVPSNQFSLVPGGTISVSRQAGDLSKFGSVARSKVLSSSSISFDATFASLTGGSKGWKTTSNAYGNLAHFESTETRKIDSSSVVESKKSFPLSSKRKKIILAPRTAPLTENPSAPKSIIAEFSTNSIQTISKEVAERKINNIVGEYFNIFDMNEVILFIKELPKEFYSKVIEIFANKALEKKQNDVDKVIILFNKLTIDNIVDKSIFIGGFTATIEFLINIGTDAPKSYLFTGQLFCAARLDSKDVSDLLKPLSNIDDKGLEKVMAGFRDEFGHLRSVVSRLLSVTNL